MSALITVSSGYAALLRQPAKRFKRFSAQAGRI